MIGVSLAKGKEDDDQGHNLSGILPFRFGNSLSRADHFVKKDKIRGPEKSVPIQGQRHV
jgi:hypothetical protein